MTNVLMRDTQKKRHGEEGGHAEMKAGTGGTRPPAKDHKESLETRGAARSLSCSLQRAQPSRHLGGCLTSRLNSVVLSR